MTDPDDIIRDIDEEANRNALQRGREKLEVRYDKMQRMYHRLLSLLSNREEIKDWEDAIDHHTQM